jgi:hypothetical protein
MAIISFRGLGNKYYETQTFCSLLTLHELTEQVIHAIRSLPSYHDAGLSLRLLLSAKKFQVLCISL